MVSITLEEILDEIGFLKKIQADRYDEIKIIIRTIIN